MYSKLIGSVTVWLHEIAAAAVKAQEENLPNTLDEPLITINFNESLVNENHIPLNAIIYFDVSYFPPSSADALGMH